MDKEIGKRGVFEKSKQFKKRGFLVPRFVIKTICSLVSEERGVKKLSLKSEKRFVFIEPQTCVLTLDSKS